MFAAPFVSYSGFTIFEHSFLSLEQPLSLQFFRASNCFEHTCAVFSSAQVTPEQACAMFSRRRSGSEQAHAMFSKAQMAPEQACAVFGNLQVCTIGDLVTWKT